jgi:hypothetical protein
MAEAALGACLLVIAVCADSLAYRIAGAAARGLMSERRAARRKSGPTNEKALRLSVQLGRPGRTEIERFQQTCAEGGPDLARRMAAGAVT